jgi:site-specific recombinase XerC
MTVLAPHLSAFLRDHLRKERNVSHHTVVAYATCFALLVRFAAHRLKHRPTDLTIEELDLDLGRVVNSQPAVGRFGSGP